MIITSARVVVGEHIISNIFSIVENKLLDMLMILEKEFGCLDELDIDTTAKSEEEIEAISNQILVLVFNDNSVTIGDGNKIKDTTILKIAKLAKEYSTAKSSTKIPVVYTRRKYIKRPNNTKSGFVVYKNETEIVVD